MRLHSWPHCVVVMKIMPDIALIHIGREKRFVKDVGGFGPLIQHDIKLFYYIRNKYLVHEENAGYLDHKINVLPLTIIYSKPPVKMTAL